MNLSGTIQQIDSLKKEADALQPVKPEFEQKFWDKYRLEFNYNSNHIEGNTLTYGHTQLLLLFDKVGGDYTLRELEEMKAHDVALRLVKEAALDPEHVLTEKFIKEINQTILVRPYYKEAITEDGQPTRRLIEPGQYKKYPNSVRLENSEIFHYASPEETSAQMGDLMEWIRKEEKSKELHPVQLAALVHYRFVRIHPFDDSNGRTSRLLMNYILIKCGYAPLVVESIDKKNYLFALNRADVGDIESFIEYISTLSLKWQETFIKATKGEDIEDADDYKKEIDLLKKKIKGSNDRIELELTSDVLETIFSTLITPLFKKIFSELSNLDELFLSQRRVFANPETGEYDINSTDELEQLLKQFAKLPLTANLLFAFIYIHKKLRKSSGFAFYHETHLIINFRGDYYEIYDHYNKDEIYLKRLYHQTITDEEMNAFSSLVIKVEFEQIKKTL